MLHFDSGLKRIFKMCCFALILALIAEMIINIIGIMTTTAYSKLFYLYFSYIRVIFLFESFIFLLIFHSFKIFLAWITKIEELRMKTNYCRNAMKTSNFMLFCILTHLCKWFFYFPYFMYKDSQHLLLLKTSIYWKHTNELVIIPYLNK